MTVASSLLGILGKASVEFVDLWTCRREDTKRVDMVEGLQCLGLVFLWVSEYSQAFWASSKTWKTCTVGVVHRDSISDFGLYCRFQTDKSPSDVNVVQRRRGLSKQRAKSHDGKSSYFVAEYRSMASYPFPRRIGRRSVHLPLILA